MPYDILSDDLYDAQQRQRNNRPNQPQGPPLRRRLLGPMFMNIFLVLLVIIALIIYFGEKPEEVEIVGELTLVGDVISFNETYSGDIIISSDKFLLETPNSKFDEGSKELTIHNFSGNIFLENNTVNFKGIGDKIEFGKNLINLNRQEFSLISIEKTNFKIFLEKFFVEFENGRIKLDDTLNYEFQNTNVTLNNYNASISFDGKFSFSGNSEYFILNSPSSNLNIIYEEESKED